MPFDVFYERAYEKWCTREHPTKILDELVKKGLSQLGERDDFHNFCAAYNDRDAEHYETKLPGTAVFAEFLVFQDMSAIDVIDLSTGSGFA